VFYDGRKVKREDTPFVKAISLRAKAEGLQRKYPKRWRYNERILNRVKSLHQRAKNIVIDGSRKFAKRLVLFAKRKKYTIVLEELTGLINEMNDTADLLPALKCEGSFSAFHGFGGTSLSIHHQAGSPAYYPYPLPRTWGYGFSQNVESTNYICVKHFV